LNIDLNQIVEGFGIFASLVIAVSLTIKNIKGLRIVNFVGSVLFAVYGILIRSPAVIILDTFTAVINIVYLFKMFSETNRNEKNRADIFDIMFVTPEDDLFRRFLRFHGEDIRRFFPSFNPGLDNPESGTLAGAESCFILRETMPVSLVSFKRENDAEITVLLDYAIPAYRDFRNANFFFNNVANRLAGPDTVFLASSEVPKHIYYLKRIGFTETGREGNTVHFRKKF
jgi:hypothetical protein